MQEAKQTEFPFPEGKVLRTDLLVYPSFFSPGQRKNIPDIVEIISGLMKKDLDVVGIGSCHTATGGLDKRWSVYRDQFNLRTFERYGLDFKNIYLGDEMLVVEDRTGKVLTLLNTQVVRSYEGNRVADVLVIGQRKLLKPSQQIEDLLNEVESESIVLLNRVGTSKGASLKLAERLKSEGRVQGFTNSAEDGVTEEDVPISGVHHYSLAGTSYLNYESEKGFDLKELKEKLEGYEYSPHYGRVSRINRFLTRDLHILMSIPRHYLAGGKKREEIKKVTGL